MYFWKPHLQVGTRHASGQVDADRLLNQLATNKSLFQRLMSACVLGNEENSWGRNVRNIEDFTDLTKYDGMIDHKESTANMFLALVGVAKNVQEVGKRPVLFS